MNKKYLMMTSIVSLISASIVQAADIVVPHKEAAPAVVVPSWSGFYLGGQIGNFASKVEIKDFNKETGILSKDKTPHPSGFMGGIYAGYNIGLGNSFILGIETDVIAVGKKDTKTVFAKDFEDDPTAQDMNQRFEDSGVHLSEDDKFTQEDSGFGTFTYKEKWSSATRVRVGFGAANHIMPYVAGGVAYAQMEGIFIITGQKQERNGQAVKTIKTISANIYDDTTTMVGYTVGGGVDFAMADNIILRAEYRYSDFGKKKFKKDQAEFKYKTNDFRVGVAYKF
ncbi:outer membrane protein [Bartonella sp. B35(2025)]